MIDKSKTYLGIELGSTRIKACLIDQSFAPIALGGFDWENKFEGGYWTYSIDDIKKGVRECFADLARNFSDKFGQPLDTVGAIGISAMMHGYLAFDKNDRLLVPFRTWRNTTTAQAVDILSPLLEFNLPQRWSSAHLFQAVLDREEHLSELAHINTLSGYIHYLLTGRRELGIGDASGMFPISENNYDRKRAEIFNSACREHGYDIDILSLLPTVAVAGGSDCRLTEEGARFLDPSGVLRSGIPVCPPEGDAGTGMVATNSVRAKTGNISAGTSVFSMLVLEKPLGKIYPEVDIVSTPSGEAVAMIHCNNCTAELDAWVGIFHEFSHLMGFDADKGDIYSALYNHAIASGDGDCAGVTCVNYLSGEHITGIENGAPLYFRRPDSKMNLANFMLSELYSSIATLKLGMDIIAVGEGVSSDRFMAHGGLFKIKGVAQKILANALNTAVSALETSGEGGAWGMALLSAYYMLGGDSALCDWLDEEVFSKMTGSVAEPDEQGVLDFDRYMERYKTALKAEKALS